MIFPTRLDKYPPPEQTAGRVSQLAWNPSLYCCSLFLLCWLIVCVPSAFAGEPEPLPNVTLTPSPGDYISDWFARVDQAQADQPHWVTPIVTITPRLEEELRYDQFWERNPGSGQSPGSLNSYGGAKGLELIPFEPVELIIGVPPYETRYGSENDKGFADWSPALLLKYRFLSANEQKGNYILTGFLSLSVPTGLNAFSMHTSALTPTIAAGKGWGDFDVPCTFGETFPFAKSRDVGDPFALNVTFQYHIFKFLWPEFEVNYTHWPNGENYGKNQVFLTPGLIVGRIPLFWRFKALIGVGYQFAASDVHPSYQSNWILTVRLPF
jgi:hypothetical protein